MRRLLPPIVLLTALITATPSLAKTVFIGHANLTAATAACSGSHLASAGKIYRVLLRPTHLNPSNPDSWLVFTEGDGEIMFSLRVATGGIAAGNSYSGVSVIIDGDSNAWSGTFPLMSSTVSTVPATAKSLTFVGRITTFLGIPACTVTFRATTLRKDGF